MAEKSPTQSLIEIPCATVLDFWFGPLSSAVAAPESSPQMRRWYGKDAATDAEIRQRFEPLYNRLASASEAGWRPVKLEEALAAILVLDQFPRNMFRDTPRMYATDRLALQISREFSEHPAAPGLDLLQASFLHMPLMHSEDKADQLAMLSYFRQLRDRAKLQASPNTAFFETALQFAVRHMEIVERFGRFPHRNAIRGRPSTPEEVAFLKEDNSSF